jgi:hypothetical protein
MLDDVSRVCITAIQRPYAMLQGNPHGLEGVEFTPRKGQPGFGLSAIWARILLSM